MPDRVAQYLTGNSSLVMPGMGADKYADAHRLEQVGGLDLLGGKVDQRADLAGQDAAFQIDGAECAGFPGMVRQDGNDKPCGKGLAQGEARDIGQPAALDRQSPGPLRDHHLL